MVATLKENIMITTKVALLVWYCCIGYLPLGETLFDSMDNSVHVPSLEVAKYIVVKAQFL